MELFTVQIYCATVRSTVFQILNVKALDRRESIDVVYLDFVKAFDTVPHKRLIGKPKSQGID